MFKSKIKIPITVGGKFKYRDSEDSEIKICIIKKVILNEMGFIKEYLIIDLESNEEYNIPKSNIINYYG
jgi:hypothetical protein